MSMDEDISKISQFKLQDYLILESMEKFKDKTIKWYDLIECRLQQPINTSSVYLPAAFLKIKGLLPDIDLGNEKQFRLNFNSLRKNGKTIDELFDESTKKKKELIYRDMLKYCRQLYREKSGVADAYGNKIDQVEKQFHDEFNHFKKYFFKVAADSKENKKDIKVADSKENKKDLKMADILKIFILYRSTKITGILYPLDIERDFLPEKAKINSIDDIFFTEKDTVSVAPLDGIVHSTNEEFIQKLYALIWVNSDISDYEVRTLLDYIALIESMTYVLVNEFWNENLIKTIGSKLLVPTVGTDNIDKEDIYDCISKRILCKFNDLKYQAIYNLKNCLLGHKIRISLYGYFIAKLYIRNKLKVFIWHKIAQEIAVKVKIDYLDLQKLKEIQEVVKDVKIEKKEDFIKLFNITGNSITNEYQNKILDIIFPDSGKSKTAKRRILENNFEKIYFVYVQFIASLSRAGVEVKFLHCYNCIISSYLYFKLQKVVIKKNKMRNFTDHCFDDRRKEIGALYKQLKKKDWQSFYYYNEISGKVFGKYYTLFNIKPPLKFVIYNEFKEQINKALIDVWQEGLNEIYEFTTVSFSTELKLVLELLKGVKDLNTIASEKQIKPNLLRKWEKEFIDKNSVVFDYSLKENLK